MRLLLINPPFYRLLGSCNPWLSPGLAYVGTAARLGGHTVLIINLDRPPVVRIRGVDHLVRAAAGLSSAVIPGHPAWQELATVLTQWSPDVIGVTVTTPTVRSALFTARIAHQTAPAVPVVAGGPHATLRARDLLIPGGFDAAVRGEGEQAITDLLDDLETGSRTTAGTVWPDGHEPPPRDLCPDIDLLPEPDVSLYGHPADGLDLGLVVGSRGCTGRCVFCASPVLWRGTVRHRSVSGIADEVKNRLKRGIGDVYFVDDQFNCDLDRAKELCRQLITSCRGVRWMCEAKVIPFDRELADLMVSSGCTRIKFGLESGSDRVLGLLNKGYTVDDVRRACEIARTAGLPLTLYVLAGIAGETPAEARATVRLVEELQPRYISVSMLTAHPGTRFAAEHGEQPPGTVCHQTAAPGAVDPEVLNRLLNYNRRSGRSRL